MKTIVVNAIDQDTYVRLNEFLIEGSWEKWVILDSSWWSTAYKKLMLWQLNKHKDDVVLICWTWAYSAAFDLFYWFQWEKILIEWCRWMTHQWYIKDVSILDSWEIRDEEDVVMTWIYKKLYKIPKFLTKEEKKRYKKWEDVYLSFDRMKEIFSDAKVIK